jgi:hypothetical protein
MKYIEWLAVFCVFYFLSIGCSNTCPAPPTTFGDSYIQQCYQNDYEKCCAYGYVTFTNQLCFNILCQPASACDDIWEYQNKECPQQETLNGGTQEEKGRTYRASITP